MPYHHLNAKFIKIILQVLFLRQRKQGNHNQPQGTASSRAIGRLPCSIKADVAKLSRAKTARSWPRYTVLKSLSKYVYQNNLFLI